jgi:penicillin-binding protein-related factor A (putative recombinase)
VGSGGVKRSNIERGRLAQAVGAEGESWIDQQHEAARLLRILAHVWHNQARTDVVRGQVIYSGKGVADYTGTVAGGIALAVEHKSTGKPRLPRSEVSALQAKHLDAQVLAGALAFLAVEFRHEDGRKNHYVCPWQQVPWEVARTASSVVEATLIPWKVMPGECYLTKYVSERLSLVAPPFSDSVSRANGGRVYARE